LKKRKNMIQLVKNKKMSILYFSVFEDLDLALIMCLCVILVCF
jgi:hypothetical protein